MIQRYTHKLYDGHAFGEKVSPERAPHLAAKYRGFVLYDDEQEPIGIKIPGFTGRIVVLNGDIVLSINKMVFSVSEQYFLQFWEPENKDKAWR